MGSVLIDLVPLGAFRGVFFGSQGLLGGPLGMEAPYRRRKDIASDLPAALDSPRAALEPSRAAIEPQARTEPSTTALEIPLAIRLARPLQTGCVKMKQGAP